MKTFHLWKQIFLIFSLWIRNGLHDEPITEACTRFRLLACALAISLEGFWHETETIVEREMNQTVKLVELSEAPGGFGCIFVV